MGTLEALETLVRFICVGKSDCGRSSEGALDLWLHIAGQEIQDLYYTFAGTEEELRDYKDAVELLDRYFAPKVNVPFERGVFRKMEQQSHEKVDHFVCRLRQKAIIFTCEFENVDETNRDQLIEECRDGMLRRKFLEKTNATVKDLQEIA